MKFNTAFNHKVVDLEPETVSKLILIGRTIFYYTSGDEWYGADSHGRVGPLRRGMNGPLIGPYKDPQQCADAVIEDYANGEPK